MEPPPGRLLPPIYEPPLQKAAYATRPAQSRGRLHPEAESATRTCYSRDRDRIIHSAAFRRLKHKTQVFVEHEGGDYYRTRLTHSLEVAQLARTISRVLAIDEDLAEVVALSHDLGHTPFGHAGEAALHRVTATIGGFDHNAHALRLVTKLEHRYADYDGLNLTWETLEGLVKHNGPLIRENLPGPIVSFNERMPLDLQSWPGLEAQIAALADDIAYVNHDLDDGLRAKLFTVDDLRDAPLVGTYMQEIASTYPGLELGRVIGELVRRLMGRLVSDLIDETSARVARAQPHSVADIRRQGAATGSFSPVMEQGIADLKAYLFAHMYRHPRVMTPVEKAQGVVEQLFQALSANPGLLPADWAKGCGSPGDAATGGVVRDYIAGMTDRFALEEYARIFHTEIRL